MNTNEKHLLRTLLELAPSFARLGLDPAEPEGALLLLKITRSVLDYSALAGYRTEDATECVLYDLVRMCTLNPSAPNRSGPEHADRHDNLNCATRRSKLPKASIQRKTS